MNRTYKFRAWDKTRNRMIVVPQITFGDDGSSLTVVVWDKTIEGFDNYYVVGESCELMQFTNLHDKNGKEIYEGDIVQRLGYMNFVVSIPTVYQVPWEPEDSEVIGNVFESPELLKAAPIK